MLNDRGGTVPFGMQPNNLRAKRLGSIDRTGKLSDQRDLT